MQEIIIYGVLALVVGFMLVSVLGKNVGHGADAPLDPEKFKENFGLGGAPEPMPRPKFEGPAAQGLAAIAESDQYFNEAGFLDGAKNAYGMILEAFADGDKETLSQLLVPDVCRAYHDAIDAREAKGQTQVTDLARLISAKIISANMEKGRAEIAVLYEAELATAIKNADGKIIDGDLDILNRVSEVWKYERRDGSDENWQLSEVAPHSSSGDDDGPDHSPDTV